MAMNNHNTREDVTLLLRRLTKRLRGDLTRCFLQQSFEILPTKIRNFSHFQFLALQIFTTEDIAIQYKNVSYNQGA